MEELQKNFCDSVYCMSNNLIGIAVIVEDLNNNNYEKVFMLL